MKTFIIFLAFVLISTSCLCFNSDFQNFVALQDRMKALAEDAAVGSALILEGEEYAKGRLIIDRAAAEEYVAFLMEEARHRACFSPERGTLSWSLTLYDDAKGYGGCELYGLSPGKPSAVVSLYFDTKGLFRLSFIDKKSVERTASYQWE